MEQPHFVYGKEGTGAGYGTGQVKRNLKFERGGEGGEGKTAPAASSRSGLFFRQQ